MTGNFGIGKFDVIDNRNVTPGPLRDVAPFVSPNVIQWYRLNSSVITDFPVSFGTTLAIYCVVIAHSTTNMLRLCFATGSNALAQNIYVCSSQGLTDTWYIIQASAIT